MRTPCKIDHGGGDGPWLSDVAAERHQAMRQCDPCPEIQQCLMGAIQRCEKFGVWGGKDFSHAATRPQLPPAPARQAPCDTEGGYRAHYRRNETPCAECVEAKAIARAGRREKAA